MAQHDYNIANQSGAAFRADLNNALLAIVSQNSGTSAPSTTFAHQLWADTTTGILKIRNAANSAWIELMQLDGTLTMEDGTALLPGLAFRDDLNTGLFSDTADTLGISTGGVERVEFGTSEVVFNDGGADVDFRIEGDTDAVLFFVDAGNDRIGVGSSTPSAKIDVSANNNSLAENNTLRFTDTDTSTEANQQIGKIEFFSNDATTPGAGVKAYIGAFAQDTSPDAYLDFATQDGSAVSTPVTRMRILSDGRVGIGTSSGLVERLHVNGGVRLDADNQGIYFNSSTTAVVGNGTDSEIYFYTSNAEKARIDSSGRLLLGATLSGSAGSMPLQVAANASAWTAAFRCRSNNDYAYLGMTNYDGTQHLNYIGTQRSADSTGNIFFGTYTNGTDATRLHISHDGIAGFFSQTYGVSTASAASASSSTYYHFAGKHNATTHANGTTSFIVYTNGDVKNTNDSYGAISDIKLKENIVDAESQWDDFKAVRFRKFNFKEETGHETFTQLGVIAQELELVCPGLVTESPDRDDDGNDLGTVTKGVKYSILTKKGLVALQEAMARIEQLEAKIAALEAQ